MPFTLLKPNGIDLAQNFTFTGTVAGAGGGKILQVLETSYATEVSSTNSSAWTDTGLTLNITPSATSSKILFLISQQGFVTRASSYTRGLFRVLRGSTTVYDSANWTISTQQNGSDISHASMFVFNGLDSPSSTSALTYKTQIVISIAHFLRIVRLYF